MLDIAKIKIDFESDLAAKMPPETLRNKYLGRKGGILTLAFQELVKLPIAQKQTAGRQLNALRQHIETQTSGLLNASLRKISNIDLTYPPLEKQIGHLHPMTLVEKELEDIFTNLGFSVEFGFEIESDWYNFTALNFPENHPARDMQDTFFLAGQENKPQKEKLLMRTHTSPMQARYMEKHKPPFAIIVPGTCYRNEATDATHEHTFGQLEGLVVGENVTFAQMIWTLDYAMKKFFGSDIKTKLLPTFFPFVEPGAELAISSPKFKNGAWVELFGCGMVHQNVFEAAGYLRNKYQGFAFGFGTSRFALMKYGIPDVRMLRENNLNFLKQF
jgi:phenylalanyl-tRNA synthetase alpha chain